MHEAKSLESMLKNHLIMNAARINFVAGYIIALLKTGTVNFKKIALAFPVFRYYNPLILHFNP